MAEPTSSAVLAGATATGLTLFGVATGLHPAILLAGLAGGLWALSYQEPAPALKRVAVTRRVADDRVAELLQHIPGARPRQRVAGAGDVLEDELEGRAADELEGGHPVTDRGAQAAEQFDRRRR